MVGYNLTILYDFIDNFRKTIHVGDKR